MAVVLNTSFFDTLPDLHEVRKEEAEMAWFVYDLVPSETGGQYTLHSKTVYPV